MSSHNNYKGANKRLRIKVVEAENELINKKEYIMESERWKNRSRTSSKSRQRVTEVWCPPPLHHA